MDKPKASRPPKRQKATTKTDEDVTFWSFIELARDQLTRKSTFAHPRANRLLLTLNRASSAITFDLESAIHRPRGWSWSGFRLLFVVWLAGPVEPKNAALLTGMSRAAVSNLSKALVADGLMVRSPGPDDGRSAQLALTESGSARMAAVFDEQNERENTWASALTDIEQDLLIMLLDKLIANRDDFDVRGRN
jgi:DNA-binding MarR family transcriptional regulator